MPRQPDSARHDTHDLELVAAFAAGDATGADLELATALVAGCPDCAALHHDLRAIAAALPRLPAPVRPRDFRLTPETAATLRPAGWRGLLGRFAGPSFRFATPLGTGLAALGIAGLLLGTSAAGGLPRSLLGGSSAASTPGAASGGSDDGAMRVAASPTTAAPVEVPVEVFGPDATPTPTGARTFAPAPSAAAAASPAPQPSPAASDGKGAFYGRLDEGSGPTEAASDVATTDPGTGLRAAVLVAGVVLLLAGVGLVGLRWASRRVA